MESPSVFEPTNERATVFTPINKRALLIGINEYLYPRFNDLSGCINDAQLMCKLLTETFDFPPENVTVLTDHSIVKPTRDVILHELNRLVSETGDDDLVVVFYAGHGSRRRNSSKASGYNETIVPRDSGRTPGHATDQQSPINRDITDDELNEYLLRPLTAKTSNLVLIFDSCHSAHILREVGVCCARARYAEADETDVVCNGRTHAQPELELTTPRTRTMASYTVKGASGWLPPSERYVLLAACQAHEKANEKHITYTDGNNTPVLIHGAWTYELVRAILTETRTDQTSTYRSIFERAFPLVTGAFPAQHPTMEGALNRAVFGLHTVPTTPYAIVLEKKEEQVRLSCGAAHGFSLGSRFVICSRGTKVRPSDDDAPTIGEITITEVGAVTSWARSSESGADLNQVDIGFPAFELAHAFDGLKVGVRIVVSPVLRQWAAAQEQSVSLMDCLNNHCSELTAFVNQSAVLFVVGAEDEAHDCITVQLSLPHSSNQRALPDNNCKPSYFIYGADGQLEVEKPIEVDPRGTNTLKNKLELLGKYHRVLSLQNSNQQDNPLQDRVELRLIRRLTDDSPWEDIPEDDSAMLPTFIEDQFVGVKIISKYSTPVEIALVELAEDGSVHVLYPPNGVSETIEPDKTLLIGSEWGALEVASCIRSQETFKLFVTTERTYFAILEQGHFRGQVESSLEELLSTDTMRLVGKRVKTDSYWTTVQRSFEIAKKTNRSINADVCHPNASLDKDHVISYETYPNNSNHSEAYTDGTVTAVSGCDCDTTMISLLAVLFDSFKLHDTLTEEECNSYVSQFYQQIQQQTMDASTTSDDITTCEAFIAGLFHEQDNILPAYEMVRAIWLNDDLANAYDCQEIQNQLSFTGFSQFVRCTNASPRYGEKIATAHYNLGLILNRSCDIVRVRDAICHYEMALEVWNKEEYAVDHGQTLSAIANVYSHLSELTENTTDKFEHARHAILLYKDAHAILEAAHSAEKYDAIVNLACVLRGLCERDLGGELADDTELCETLIENAIYVLRSSPLTTESAESLVDMVRAKYELLRRDLALPWPEEVIHICNELLASQLIDDQSRIDCIRILGDALGSRLVGNRFENLQRAAENLLVAAESYSRELGRNDCAKRFAVCVINLGAIVKELRSTYKSTEIDVYVDKCKTLLGRVISESFDAIDSDLKGSALYNLSRFADDNIAELQAMVPIAAEHAPRVCGRLKADLALRLLSRSFPGLDGALFEDVTTSHDIGETLGETCVVRLQPAKGFATTRFEHFRCDGGADCGHTEEVLRYLQDAEELLSIEKDQDTGYIKNLGVMGRYWATHCKLSLNDKMNLAWESYLKAIIEVDRNWPLYNVDAQVTFMDEVGQLWEDALDVAVAQYFLQIGQHSQTICQHICDILCSAKCRNLLPTLHRLTLNNPASQDQVLQACTTPSSTSLSASQIAEVISTWRSYTHTTTGILCNIIEFLQQDEVVVEWWMSTKQYAFCIVYSKKDFKMCQMWNEAESAELYHLCLEAHGNQKFHSWNHAFIVRLSQALRLEALYAFLVEHFSTASKLFLVPHVYLYSCPIHALPIFADKSLCLLDTFPAGISYLPNCKILSNLRQPLVNNTQSNVHAFLFQADPNRDLPHSSREINNIEGVVKATGNTCSVFLNTTAQMFVSALPSPIEDRCLSDGGYNSPFLLHVACHGEYIDATSAESYLLFEDGTFTMTQFQNVSLNCCQLAVLSACNSGLRDFTRTHMTDIFIGFGAQFLAKGCKNVLLTLSPVSDQSTAELMLHFYRGFFQEKKSVAASLRDAQLKLRDRVPVNNGIEDGETHRLVGKKTANNRAIAGYEWLYSPFVLLGAGDYGLSNIGS